MVLTFGPQPLHLLRPFHGGTTLQVVCRHVVVLVKDGGIELAAEQTIENALLAASALVLLVFDHFLEVFGGNGHFSHLEHIVGPVLVAHLALLSLLDVVLVHASLNDNGDDEDNVDDEVSGGDGDGEAFED